jgi:hypothetical protein
MNTSSLCLSVFIQELDHDTLNSIHGMAYISNKRKEKRERERESKRISSNRSNRVVNK